MARQCACGLPGRNHDSFLGCVEALRRSNGQLRKENRLLRNREKGHGSAQEQLAILRATTYEIQERLKAVESRL